MSHSTQNSNLDESDRRIKEEGLFVPSSNLISSDAMSLSSSPSPHSRNISTYSVSTSSIVDTDALSPVSLRAVSLSPSLGDMAMPVALSNIFQQPASSLSQSSSSMGAPLVAASSSSSSSTFSPVLSHPGPVLEKKMSHLGSRPSLSGSPPPPSSFIDKESDGERLRSISSPTPFPLSKGLDESPPSSFSSKAAPGPATFSGNSIPENMSRDYHIDMPTSSIPSIPIVCSTASMSPLMPSSKAVQSDQSLCHKDHVRNADPRLASPVSCTPSFYDSSPSLPQQKLSNDSGKRSRPNRKSSRLSSCFCAPCDCVAYIWMHPSSLAHFVRWSCFILLFMAPSLLLHYLFPQRILLAKQTLIFWSAVIASVLFGYPVLSLLLRVTLHFCSFLMKNSENTTSMSPYVHSSSASFATSMDLAAVDKNGSNAGTSFSSSLSSSSLTSFIFYLSELQGHLSFFLYILMLTILYNASQLREIMFDLIDPSGLNKAFFSLLFGILVFAYKSHFVHKLAMTFNYTNYMDRIQDCLFAEYCMSLLTVKAKALYKVRRRAWAQLQATREAARLQALREAKEASREIAGRRSPGKMRFHMTHRRVHSTEIRTLPKDLKEYSSSVMTTSSMTPGASLPALNNFAPSSSPSSPSSSKATMLPGATSTVSGASFSISNPVPSTNSPLGTSIMAPAMDNVCDSAVKDEKPSSIITPPGRKMSMPDALSQLTARSSILSDASPSNLSSTTPVPSSAPSPSTSTGTLSSKIPSVQNNSDSIPTNNMSSSNPLFNSSTAPSSPALLAAQASFNIFNVQQEVEAFHRLARRLMTQFDDTYLTSEADSTVDRATTSTSSKPSDMHSSMRREARVMARRLFKWLMPFTGDDDEGMNEEGDGTDGHSGRNYLTKEDLMVVVKDTNDVNRLWCMLCQRGDTMTQTLGSHPVSSQPIYENVVNGIPLKTTASASKGMSASAIPFFMNTSAQATVQRGVYPISNSGSPLASFPYPTATTTTSSSPYPAYGQGSPKMNGGSSTAFITRQNLAEFIERTYREVVGVSKSLRSMETAVRKLNILTSLLLIMLLSLFFAVIYGEILSVMLSVTQLLFGAAFMFGTSAKNTFESIIFLFVNHPFDVGDRVFLNLSPGSGPPPPAALPGAGALLTNASPASGSLENLVVVEMHLMTTLFERWDGAKLYIPNYVLATKPILNVRRSGALWENHRLQMAFDTPLETLNVLKARIADFLKREHADYTEQLLMNVESFENMNRMHVVIMVQHRTNWQDFEAQLSRKSKILVFLKEQLEDLGILYYPPVQRIEMVSRVFPESNMIDKNGIGHSILGATC